MVLEQKSVNLFKHPPFYPETLSAPKPGPKAVISSPFVNGAIVPAAVFRTAVFDGLT